MAPPKPNAKAAVAPNPSATISTSKKRALEAPPVKPQTSSNTSKKAKLEPLSPPKFVARLPKVMPKPVELPKEEVYEDEDEEEAENDDEGEDDDALSEEVQGNLDHATALVEMLSKSYLKDVMKGLGGFYGSRSGTNRAMAAEIVSHLEDVAKLQGGDLVDELKVIKRVNCSCWGGCAEDSDGDDDEEY